MHMTITLVRLGDQRFFITSRDVPLGCHLAHEPSGTDLRPSANEWRTPSSLQRARAHRVATRSRGTPGVVAGAVTVAVSGAAENRIVKARKGADGRAWPSPGDSAVA